MSDVVIRFGGSHIGNQTSLQNLKSYLQQYKNRNFVIVSAIPELLDYIELRLANIFLNELNEKELYAEIASYYTLTTGQKLSDDYENLANQLIGLLKGIRLIGDYSWALKDQVLNFAEKLSVEILHASWPDATVLPPDEVGLFTSTDFGNATFLSVDKKKVENLKKQIYLFPGTFGITEKKKEVRAGKTAADYTAAFLAKELGTKELKLWGMDQHFYRADPSIQEELPLIQRLTYSEASELAYFEHYSFHPRTVEPLEHEHIPIVVIDTNSAIGEVKTIINTETYVEDQIVKCVASTDDISVLKFNGPGVGLKPGILAKVTAMLSEAGINIKSVITSQTSINFILNGENGTKALKLTGQLDFSAVTDISLLTDVSLIGVVGHGMQNAFGVSAKIFAAVANNQINVLLSGSGASDLVSYLIVHKSDKEKSVHEIYNAFFKNQYSVSSHE